MEKTIQVFPLQRHFGKLTDFVSEIKIYEDARKFHVLGEDTNSSKDKFERIRLNDGSFILLPVGANFTLYRGQNQFYDKCVPTLFREELSEIELFVCYLKWIEVEILIKSHPAVKQTFNNEKYKVDFLGLAQHYGIKTNILDLTSDIDVAMFFATCKYDKKTNKYYPQDEEKEYQGAMYILTLDHGFIGGYDFFEDFLSNKLQVIGLQPFARPGSQKGFALHMNKGESLNAIEYTFNYTKNDSLHYYNMFNQGESIWINDAFSEKVNTINNSLDFSIDAFELAIKRFGSMGKEAKYYQSLLHENGYGLKDRNSLCWTFTQKEITDMENSWNSNGEKDFCDKIIFRNVINGDKSYNERSIYEIAILFNLRLFKSLDNCNINAG